MTPCSYYVTGRQSISVLHYLDSNVDGIDVSVSSRLGHCYRSKVQLNRFEGQRNPHDAGIQNIAHCERGYISHLGFDNQ